MNGNFTARIGARITEFMARMRQVQNTIRTTANDVRVDIGADVSEFNRRMAEIRARIAALVREKVVIKIEARIEDFQRKIQRIASNLRAFGELAQHTISGSLIAVLPAIVPIIANVGVAIANLGVMLGVTAGSAFALVGAFTAAGAAAGAFAAVAIPTIKKLFDENAQLNSVQKSSKASFDNMKKTYQSLVTETEKPVLQAFTSAMQFTDALLTKLRPLLLSSAQAVANLMDQLNKAIATPPIQKFLDYLNTSGATMLETFSRSFGNLFKGLLSMLTAFAPLSASTAKGFEAMTARFAEWANGLSDSAKFQSFMDYVATNMPKVRAIFRDATAGVIYFFSAFAGSSQGMMDGLVSMMARFKEWSATLSQSQGFQQFIDYVHQTAPSVMSLIGNLTKFLVNLGIGMAPLGATIINLANKFLEFANSLMEGNRTIGVLIAGFISFGGILLALVPNIIAFGTLFKGLIPAITKVGSSFIAFLPRLNTLGTTIANLATRVIPALGPALGIITSNVGIVIGVVTGLIAIFVGLYNTNETFRSQVQTVWAAIKTAISTAVTAVGSLISSVWSQITSFWNENQESIKSTASTVWKAIGNIITTVMSAIGAIMQFIWPVVKAIIVSTWEAIKNVINGVTKVILGIIQTFSSLFQGDWKGVWDGIKQILNGALQAVWGVVNLYFVGKLLGPLKAFGSTAKTFLQGVWTAIKGIFTNTLNTLKSLVTSVFNSMKSTITSVWNSIKSFFTTVLNGIKSVFTNIWRSIATFLDNLFTSISGLVRSVWNGIKNVISSILNAIANVVKSIWTGIKTATTSILNGIKSVIDKIWNGFKTTVTTAMDNVKTAVVNGWNKAKSFLESVNLHSIGRYIIQGLVNGISSMMDSVKSKISEIANAIPEKFKKLLGIHSPAREMIGPGADVVNGILVGVEGRSPALEKAMVEMVNVILKTVDNSNAQVEKLTKENATKLAKIETDKAYNIQQIHLKAQAAKRKLTAADLAHIKKLEADAAAKSIAAQEKYAEKIKAIQEKADTARLDSVKSFIEGKRELELISNAQEARLWEEALKTFTDGTTAKIKAQIQYKNALKAVSEELATINETYSSRISEVNKNLKEEEEKLTKVYEDAVKDREKSLRNLGGIFEAFEVKIDRSGNDLLNNLKSQVDGFKAWQAEVEKLSEKAIDKGLLEELRQMGPAALGELKALNSLSEHELKQYSDMYQEMGELARTQAEAEFKGLKDSTQLIIASMTENAEIELDNLHKEWTAAVKGITEATSDGFSSLPEIGRQAGQGLLNGLSSMQGPLEAKAREIATSIATTMQSALDIHSPSRLTRDLIGVNVVKGVIVGIESMKSLALKATINMSQWFVPKVPTNQLNATLDTIGGLHDKLVELSAHSADERIKIEEDYNKQMAVLNKEREKALYEYIDAVNAAQGGHSFEVGDAYDQYSQVTEQIDEVTAAYKEQLAVIEESLKERFEVEKAYVEQRKKFNTMSLADELEAYQNFLANYAEGTEERIYYEEKIVEAKKAIHNELVKINDDYLKKIQDANQKLIDGEAALNKAYEDAVSSRKQSLYSTVGLFDAVSEKSEVSGQELISNLRGQNDAFKDWMSDLQSLTAKGLDKGLLAELQAMGPKAASEITALNGLSEAELAEYTALWKEKSELAHTQSISEHEQMRLDTEAQIQALRASTAAQLDMYAAEWQAAVSEIREGTKDEFNSMVADMPEIGGNVIKGMQQGLSEMIPALLAQAQAIAEAIKQTIQDALDIHSPSRWGKKFVGHNLIKGIIIGLADMKSDAIKAAERVAEWIQPHVEVSDIIKDISGAIDAIQTEIEHKVKVDVEVNGAVEQGTNDKGVHQEVHLHSPTPLSPSENARQLKKVAQQMAYN
ncbi:hypothetical protein [Lysinibacillus sp. ACHW1.5]|uniref:phage tail protein n=1 Tax=Lysinibacillus sp. ACHW1.5 TaxID=2913506 RepID=UPI001EDA4212|nr:hypothetical protein [Lysinibacillus sp. ACHW1.5]UKJ44286.1 hypothetical protein L6W14_16165 [Lysinibacillus sp. ACHW1.5]